MNKEEVTELLSWATAREREYLEAIERTGSIAATARELGVTRPAIQSALHSLRKRAARKGFAPNHFESGVAPGYLMGKVTVQRSRTGDVERTWERQSPEAGNAEAALRAAAEAMAQALPRVKPTKPPAMTDARLCNTYVLTDCHMGMLAWHREGGADWDVGIAERTLTGCFEHMVRSAPRAAVGVVAQLGDFLHSDGLQPVTPTSHHVLDQDGRYEKIVSATIRVLRRVVDFALAHHERVVVLMAEGNHDLAGSVWLRCMFKALYESEPRVTVIDSALPYYVHQHGETMIGFHHGHLKKNDDLPLLFAAQFPKVWGATGKRYCHTGHRHHAEEKEHSGMLVIQHPTLAARDAYAARGGWLAERQATALTFHDRHGLVARNSVTPEMLAEA